MMRPICLPVLAASTLCLLSGCANFRRLGEDLRFMERNEVLTGRITNLDVFEGKRVLVYTFEWDRTANEIRSMDYAELAGAGLYGFFVAHPKDQHMAAYADLNRSDRYESGEPFWIHRGPDGQPAPVVDRPTGPDAVGRLSVRESMPDELRVASADFSGIKHRDELKTGWEIPISLGEVASFDEARFSSERAATGYWQPASYPMETGLGIYFMSKYDASKVPVVLVHGAAGSPRDFEELARHLDTRRFQVWFYHYPSGRDLTRMGASLDWGLRVLQETYGFERAHIVAHSMGGLVARRAILDSLEENERTVGRFVSISSPFGGQEGAATGVKRAPAVSPSWRNIEPGSEFLEDLFDDRLKPRIPHLLIYGDRSSRKMMLPAENDGTLSVASMTCPDARKDAVAVEVFHEDHVSILSNRDVISRVNGFLLGANE